MVKQTEAVPAMYPPILQLTSKSAVGLAEWSAELPGLPISTSVGELLAPAWINKPAMVTPSTSATVKAAVPFVGVRTGRPMPITTVFGCVTSIGPSSE